MEWLELHYLEEVQIASDDLFFSFRKEFEEELFDELMEVHGGFIEFNYLEWVIADSVLSFEDDDIRTIDLLLSDRGPRYTKREREMLELLRDHPLHLYEATKTDHQNGTLFLKELTIPGRKKKIIEVYDKNASMTVPKKAKFGCRIIPWNGQNILTGTIYPFSDELAKLYLKGFPDLEKNLAKIEPMWRNVAHSHYLISAWAFELMESLSSRDPEKITLIDQKTEDPILFTTDLYDIKDIKALTNFIESEEHMDTNGNNGWVWLTPPYEDGLSRSRGELTLTKKNRMKVVSNTVQKADDIKAELESALGNAIVYLTRQLEDVSSEKFLKENISRQEKDTVDEDMLASPEFAEAIQNHIQSLYHNWADDPLPAFDNKTPRQMLKKKGGEKKVREMIEIYELQARRQHVEQKLPLASYDFLYEQLGIEREE